MDMRLKTVCIIILITLIVGIFISIFSGRKENNSSTTTTKPIQRSLSIIGYKKIKENIEIYLTNKRECIIVNKPKVINIVGLNKELYDKYGIKTTYQYINQRNNGYILILTNEKINGSNVCGNVGYLIINHNNITFIIHV